MKVIGIIQARMGSTRLPGKVMMPLGNTVLLEYVCQRAENTQYIDQVVVATSKNPIDNPIEEWCNKHNILVFRGSEEDLLERFLTCAQQYQADYFVRITGDCPFISMELASELIQKTIESKSQYGRIDSVPIPLGIKISVIETNTLTLVNKKANHPYYREHITLYMDEHLSEFKVCTLYPYQEFNNKRYRLTVDTKEDLMLCNKIVAAVGNNLLIDSKEIVHFLDLNTCLLEINKSIVQKSYVVNNRDVNF